MQILAGRSSPLGATWDGPGVNFALASERASAVELCLFDSPTDTIERTRVALPGRSGDIFHGYVPGLGAGQLYGYRVHGAWDPSRGLRFNPAKIVLDPYARAIGRAPVWHPSLFGYAPGSEGDGSADVIDSAPYAPLALVHDPAIGWAGDRPPRRTAAPDAGLLRRLPARHLDQAARRQLRDCRHRLPFHGAR